MKPPKKEQVQLIVFGTGEGESILIHLGDNNWVIVDSCVVGNEPVALSYLNKIGVDLKSDVKLIVATHWHKDHVVGLNTLLSECDSAEFAIPNVLEEKLYKKFLIVNEEVEGIETGINQFTLAECLETLYDRGETPLYLTERMHMWVKDAMNFSHKNNVKIVALSPSTFRYDCFLKDIHRYEQSNFQKMRSEKSNLYSVAMKVSIGEFNILLGSDLMVVSNSKCGWNNIIKNEESISPNTNIYSIYKVAHHGSKHSYQDDIWTKLIKKDPTSIITPNKKNNLPEYCTLKKIIKNSKRTFVTSVDSIEPKNIDVVVNGDSSNLQKFSYAKPTQSYVKITIDMKKCDIIASDLGEFAHELICESGEIELAT